MKIGYPPSVCILLALIWTVVLSSCATHPSSPAPKPQVANQATEAPMPQSSAAAVPYSELPFVTLKDQNDEPQRRKPEARVLVIVLVNSKWRHESEAWSRKLLEVLPPTAQIIDVLSLQDSSPKLAKVVAAGIRFSVGKEDVQILMDWEGKVTSFYKISPESPAVICLNEQNTPVRIVQGPCTPENADLVLKAYK